MAVRVSSHVDGSSSHLKRDASLRAHRLPLSTYGVSLIGIQNHARASPTITLTEARASARKNHFFFSFFFFKELPYSLEPTRSFVKQRKIFLLRELLVKIKIVDSELHEMDVFFPINNVTICKTISNTTNC